MLQILKKYLIENTKTLNLYKVFQSVKNLLTLFEQVEDDKKEFKLIYSSNKLNKFLILERGTEKFYLYRQRPIYPLSQQKPK